MKKLVLLLLTLSLLTMSALAEMPFEAAVIPFEDYGVQIALPSDWNMLALDDAAKEAGMICAVASPDMARKFTLQFSQLEKETTLEEVKAGMEAAYGKAEIVTLGENPYVTFDLTDKDMTALATLTGDGMGMFVLYFNPGSDQDYGPIAQAIAASFGGIEQ